MIWKVFTYLLSWLTFKAALPLSIPMFGQYMINASAEGKINFEITSLFSYTVEHGAYLFIGLTVLCSTFMVEKKGIPQRMQSFITLFMSIVLIASILSHLWFNGVLLKAPPTEEIAQLNIAAVTVAYVITFFIDLNFIIRNPHLI